MELFAVTQGIVYYTDIKWWVSYTLSKSYRNIAEVNSRVIKQKHKNGIEVSTTTKHAKIIGEKNENK